jgi:hypothetical protein
MVSVGSVNRLIGAVSVRRGAAGSGLLLLPTSGHGRLESEFSE